MELDVLNGNHIAVIGMALNIPGAENLDQFWNNLKVGVESYGTIADDELSELGMDESARQNPGWVLVRGFPSKPKDFDAAFFGLPPRDAVLMDPQQRFLLECSQNAFDDAGYDPLAFAGDVGVWMGTGNSSYYAEFLEPALRNDPQQQFSAIILNDHHFPATRVAYMLNLRGPAVNVATACSTGLVAVHSACAALRRNECDMALVGASRINTGAYTGYPRMEGMIYSSDGHCRVFDSRADGTVFTNGTACVLLKRLDQAIKDGDNIRSIILGSAVNNDGAIKSGFTAPSIDGQEAVLEEAYEDAQVDPSTISFIEGHGTATLLGDPIEVHALTRVFRRRTDARGFCLLGSVKANVGHLEQAAGIVGLIKATLALERGEVPGTLHFNRPNPALNLDTSPFIVNRELTPWMGAAIRRAAVSSFGIGGTNAHAVLQEAPKPASTPNRRVRHLLPVSAKTTTSRDRNLENLGACFVGSTLDLADVAYTLQLGRRGFPVRAIVSATSLDEAVARFRRDAIASTGPVRRDVASVWMFTGQGSQYPGMARGLYDEEEEFRSVFDYCSDYLATQLGVDLRDVVLNVNTPASELEQTRIAQPALFVVEVAMARQLQKWGIKPSALIGHSIGEYAAACIAEVFSLDDALSLVAARGALMQSLPSGTMLSVNAPAKRIAEFLDQQVNLAAVNSPEHCVLSGPHDAIRRVAQRLTEISIVNRPLQTSHAFHSAMMDPILAEFELRVAKVSRNNPRIPYVSNLTGTWIEDSEATSPEYWSQHLRGTVRFADGLQAICEARPADVLIELGPSTTLSSLASLNSAAMDHPKASLGRHARDDRPDGQVFLDGVGQIWVAGGDLEWDRFYNDEKRRKVSLPGYAFQREEYFFNAELQSPTGRRYEVHPLLGQMHRSAIPRAESVFDATVSPWTPAFLMDHTIFGQAIMPAACYIEVALAVAKQFLRGESFSITDLQVKSPVVLPRDGERRLQTIVMPDGEGAWRMRLFSLPPLEGMERDASIEWEEHVSARIEKFAGQAADVSADLSAWRARITKEVPTHLIYDNQSAGFRWGPSFQSVKQVFVGEWECLARIQLPKLLDYEARDFTFHPSLLDGCFQLPAGAIPRELIPGMTMPVAADRILMHGAAPTEFWCHISGRPEEISSQGITVDFRMISDDGREFARVEKYQSLLVTQSSLLETSARVGSWFHRILWRNPNVPMPVDELVSSCQLVFFADRGGMAERVARKAIDAGLVPPILIYRAADLKNMVVRSECETLAFDPTSESEIVTRLSKVNAALFCGNFWPLDMEGGAIEQCENLVSIVIALSNDDVAAKKLMVVTRGAQQTRSERIVSPDQAALWGLQRVVFNEHAELGASLVDLDAESNEPDRDALSLLELLRLRATVENQICIRNEQMFVARLSRIERQKGSTNGPFVMRLAEYGSLDSLMVGTLRLRKPGKNELKIGVRASAVNFRDVLQVMGAMRAFNEAAGILDPAQVPIGFECAGEILEVGDGVADFKPGDRVLAFGHGCHASHFYAAPEQVVRIPDSLDVFDAVALPTVLVTALYGLDRLAKLKKGDRILIHSCAGGVGQAALQVARRAGATVFATASPSKWDFLRQQGVEHIWSSRDHNFAEGIMNATGGTGVDVVLNALNGEYIEKTLSVLAQRGRFVEIGKIGAWTKQQMERVRPDVEYFKFDLSDINTTLFREILQEGVELIASGALQRLPVRRFPVREYADAFRWVAQGRNVGKAVLEMPTDLDSGITRNDRSYLITGGLGALGLVMARGLVDSGARHVALVGRSKPSNVAEEVIQQLRDIGAEVKTFQADIGVRKDAEALFEMIDASMPPIGGVLHAAGVLDDGVVVKMDAERLTRVMSPKVVGAWNLHDLTRTRNLDFFVLFSSIAAALGSAGQGSYSAANAYMDALAAVRVAEGMHALSVGWGAWADGGMAVEVTERYRVQRAAMGLKDIQPSEGVIALNNLLDRGTLGHVTAMPVQWSKYLAQYVRGGSMPPLFEDLAAALHLEAAGSGEAAQQVDVSLMTEIKGANPVTRRQLLVAFVARQAAGTVGIEAALVEDTTSLMELGVDSLMAMELRTRVTRAIGIQLPLSLLIGDMTIADVASNLADAIEADMPQALDRPAAAIA